jgi:hypothetical protein
MWVEGGTKGELSTSGLLSLQKLPFFVDWKPLLTARSFAPCGLGRLSLPHSALVCATKGSKCPSVRVLPTPKCIGYREEKTEHWILLWTKAFCLPVSLLSNTSSFLACGRKGAGEITWLSRLVVLSPAWQQTPVEGWQFPEVMAFANHRINSLFPQCSSAIGIISPQGGQDTIHHACTVWVLST